MYGHYVFNGQQRVWEEEKLLGYDLKLIFSHCTKDLLNFDAKSVLWLNAQFREYKQNMHLVQDLLPSYKMDTIKTCKTKAVISQSKDH